MNTLDGTGAYEGLDLILADTSGGDQGWVWAMPDGSLPAIPDRPAA